MSRASNCGQSGGCLAAVSPHSGNDDRPHAPRADPGASAFRLPPQFESQERLAPPASCALTSASAGGGGGPRGVTPHPLPAPQWSPRTLAPKPSGSGKEARRPAWRWRPLPGTTLAAVVGGFHGGDSERQLQPGAPLRSQGPRAELSLRSPRDRRRPEPRQSLCSPGPAEGGRRPGPAEHRQGRGPHRGPPPPALPGRLPRGVSQPRACEVVVLHIGQGPTQAQGAGLPPAPQRGFNPCP